MWVKIDDGFATHPKVMNAGIIALGIQIRAICYASQHKTDGFIPLSVIPLLLIGIDHDPNIIWPAHMVFSGLWEAAKDGYIIHDYLAWNLSKQEVESFTKKKSRAGKKGMKARWTKEKEAVDPSITPVITPVKQRAITNALHAISISNTLSSPNSEEGKESEKGEFEEFWNTYPKKAGKKAAQKAFHNAQDRPRIDDLLEAIRKQGESPQWLKDGGQYIPYPATWLNRGQWADVAAVQQPSVFEEFLARGGQDCDDASRELS